MSYLAHMSHVPSPASDYAAAHVRRALARDEAREVRRTSLRARARKAAQALYHRYGDGISVYLFGSVVEPGSFRLDSDVDLAVRGVPIDQYYEAWGLAEAVFDDGRLDLIRLEDAPTWLAEEVERRGELLS